MKYLLKTFCLLLTCLCSGLLSAAQENEAPYLKQKALPSFTIRLLDSSLWDTKNIPAGKPTALILFSPDCSHCAEIAQTVKSRIAAFEDINLYFIAPPMPFYDIRRFAHINGLAGKSRLTVGQDTDFFFGSFFKAETVPFVVIYDRHKKFAAVLKHMKSVDELLAETAKLK